MRLAIAVLMLAVSACQPAEEEIRIGVTLRMVSDNGEKYGQMIVDELSRVNEEGGIHGRPIKLFLLNDECRSDKGVANANKLIYQHEVHMLIGSTCSSVSLPIVDVTAKAEVPQIIPHSTDEEITKKGSAWVFRVPISSRYYKGVAAKYVAENVGTKIAYLYATDAASEAFGTGFIEQMRTHYGVEPVYAEQVQEQEIDFRSHLLKIRELNPDALVIATFHEPMARVLVQSYEVGIPRSVHRIGSSVAALAPVPNMAGDAIEGVFFAAAFSASDDRPVAREFTRMVRERYGVHLPDHDFSQAWDLTQIVQLALSRTELKLTKDALADDRAAIRDAFTSIENYEGLASGPISFCADPTPQCRDGNRTVVLIAYTKGGENFETEILARIPMPIDFGL